MNQQEFTRILTTFADTPASIDINRGKLVCEIRDEMIEVDTRIREGEVWVTDGGQEMRGTTWLLNRVARLPILADRILAAFKQPSFFTSPTADLTDQLDDSESDGRAATGDAVDLALEMLGRRPMGCSNVLYLTSDAGEGKTTLITHLARYQAEKCKRKESDWLLVPIALGGKPFLRFDDLVVGFLGNRLRFPLFYFDAFMELVKLGVLVPAFDGFEEMFVQDAKGDALSAVGNLMRALDSSGTVLIAARRAYFEYQDIRTQARLFDSIGHSSVVFSRLSLRRWEKTQFLSYSERRGAANSEKVYSSVAERLQPSHPLLTRAVLVKRLLDVAEQAESLAELLKQIGNSPNDYFGVFVQAIVEREAHEKWIDTTGDAARPLLSVQEHFELLSAVAQEMWILSTDSLKADVLDLITDLFCETRQLPAAVAFQIRERTKQHALIMGTDGAKQTFAFDHEEFRSFFIGQYVGRLCMNANQKQKTEVLGLLRKANLPGQALDAAVSIVKRAHAVPLERVAAFLQEVALLDGPTSFTQENAARLIIRIIDGVNGNGLGLHGLRFGSEALRDLHLVGVSFTECSFGSTSLQNTRIEGCLFDECHFDRLDLDQSMTIISTRLMGSDFVSVVPVKSTEAVYDPSQFAGLLRSAGFEVGAGLSDDETLAARSEDPEIKLLRRLLRCFHVRTHLNENVILRKLGPGAEMFLKTVMPRLVKAQVISKEWNARDHQDRFYIILSMERIHDALRDGGSSVESFLHRLSTSRVT